MALLFPLGQVGLPGLVCLLRQVRLLRKLVFLGSGAFKGPLLERLKPLKVVQTGLHI